MIKYRTRFDKIEPLEVERETDKQVVLAARIGFRSSRENKVSDWSNWHDTWEAAHSFLIAEAERDVASLRMRLEQAKGKLGNIKGMRPNVKVRGGPEAALSPEAPSRLPGSTTQEET